MKENICDPGRLIDLNFRSDLSLEITLLAEERKQALAVKFYIVCIVGGFRRIIGNLYETGIRESACPGKFKDAKVDGWFRYQ